MKIISADKIYLWLILLSGAGFRIFRLGENSFWTDEAGFIIFRNGGLPESLSHIFGILQKGHIANMGYFFFVTLWSYLFEGEFMLRLSSAAFGILSVFLIYKLGDRLFDKKTGLFSAFILAISPFHIYYSQEFRMYTLVALLTVASVYSLESFLQTKKNRYLISYAVCNILNIYFHLTAVLVLFSQAVYFIVYIKKYRGLIRRWVLAHLAILFFVSPVIILAIDYLLKYGGWLCSISTLSVLGHLSLPVILFTFKNFSAGYNSPLAVYLPLAAIFLGLSARGVFKNRNRRQLGLVLCCLLIPIFLMYIMQKFIYADRYLIPNSIFFYLLAASGLSDLRKRHAVILALLICVLCLFSLKDYYENRLPGMLDQRIAVHSRKEHREATAYIIENFREGDIIFHADANTVLPLQYYFNYLLEDKKDYSFNKYRYNLVLRLSEDRQELRPFKAWADPGWELFKDQRGLIPAYGHERVWLVFSAREFERALKSGSYERRALELMDKNYTRADARAFNGIIVYLFTRQEKKGG